VSFHADPNLARKLDVDRTAAPRALLFGLPLDYFVIRYADRQQLHRTLRHGRKLAFAIQASPVKHHVRVQPMNTSHSRYTCPRLTGLLNNQPLLRSRTTLPYLPNQHSRIIHQLIVKPTSPHATDGKTTRLPSFASTPICAFRPKYHWSPFFVWCISGSRSPLAFLVEEGAWIQGLYSKADARDRLTGLPTPEAPRQIYDILATIDQLPLHLVGRSEYEEVSRKPLGQLDDGSNADSVSVRELRAALIRPFQSKGFDVGVNVFIASGYGGQTLESIALPERARPSPGIPAFL